MRRFIERIKAEVREDARDGWVAYIPGELPVVFAGPMLVVLGSVLLVASFIALIYLQPAALLVGPMAFVFLWLGIQMIVGWRQKR